MPTSRAWDIQFFRRHRKDDPEESVPARVFLDACPDAIAAKLLAVVKAVSEAPPPAFAGGGKWEAMHGVMKGIYEVRVDGPKRRHYRLYCLLEQPGPTLGLTGPSIVLLDGRSKAFRTTITTEDYRSICALAQEFRARAPRSVST